MNECMRTGDQKIAILMATYEPVLEWLEQQLCSINNQIYENLSFYLYDDGSQRVSFEEIKKCVYRCITRMPVEILHNEQNMGSNVAFERLTEVAKGEYFAYADQDDIWEVEKLSSLMNALQREDAVMAYSDMSVIDAQGKKQADSLAEFRPRLKYVSGNNLLEKYFFRNCTAGCSMVLKSSVGKAALPFPVHTVCDQWLAILAAREGKIAFVNKPLVRYRQHENNQTGVLRDINDIHTYREKHLMPLCERMEYLKKYCEIPDEMQNFINARLNGNIFGMWKGRAYSPYEAKFEIIMKIFPSHVVSKILGRIKNRSNQ